MTDRRRQPALGRIRQVHMVGIGGIGMSSIAEVLLNRGYRVTGSDLTTSDVTRHLEDLGATIHEGHAADQIGEADVVVYSSAVDPDDNPETREAERRRISLIPRAEMLGELIRMKFGVGVRERTARRPRPRWWDSWPARAASTRPSSSAAR
jgi:UDP-N-acetylmuramate--alanine ligase